MRTHVTKRHALTLVELLVVVAILVILVAVVLPLAAPALRGRELREGTRQLSAVLARVQTDATSKNRDYGVRLLDISGDNRCFQVQFVKSRRMFNGVTTSTRVQKAAGDNDLVFSNDGSVDGRDTELALKTLLGDHDRFFMRLDYRGEWHEMAFEMQQVGWGGGGGDGRVFKFASGSAPSNFSETNSVPFQIRLPPRSSLAAPTELPKGAYIDLIASGIGTGSASGLAGADLMFGGDGRLKEIWTSTGVISNPATVFLLVANSKELPTNVTPSAKSLWVTIGNRTNRIATVESLGSNNPTYVDAVSEARQSALAGISASGR